MVCVIPTLLLIHISWTEGYLFASSTDGCSCCPRNLDSRVILNNVRILGAVFVLMMYLIEGLVNLRRVCLISSRSFAILEMQRTLQNLMICDVMEAIQILRYC